MEQVVPTLDAWDRHPVCPPSLHATAYGFH